MGTNHYCKRGIYSDDELVACYLKYESQIKASKELGVSRETIARAVRRRGIPMTGRRLNGNTDFGVSQPGIKITNEELTEEAKRFNTREIAIKYDMSEERVHRRAKKIGIEAETAPGPGSKWKRRAIRYECGEYDETITLAKLIKRYRGVCQICGGQVNESDIKNGHIGRMYPTLDHIIPMSKGGNHTWDNVQLAHMHCNSGKGDKV